MLQQVNSPTSAGQRTGLRLEMRCLPVPNLLSLEWVPEPCALELPVQHAEPLSGLQLPVPEVWPVVGPLPERREDWAAVLGLREEGSRGPLGMLVSPPRQTIARNLDSQPQCKPNPWVHPCPVGCCRQGRQFGRFRLWGGPVRIVPARKVSQARR